MRTILIPVDFSETSRNAALYAANLGKTTAVTSIVLFNAYSMPLATEMSWAVVQSEELHEASVNGLQNFKEWLQAQCPEIEIVSRSEFGFLGERIETLCEEINPWLVIMGITGGGKIEEVLMGSNTMHVVHHIKPPVLIVPPDARWKNVAEIGWACDYKEIEATTPTEQIKDWCNLFKAKLFVAHNNPEPNAFDADAFHQNVVVNEMFLELEPEFVMLDQPVFTDAINEFVDNRAIDWLLVVPKKYGWLESIFHRSHTKQLAFHSHVPVLCLKKI